MEPKTTAKMLPSENLSIQTCLQPGTDVRAGEFEVPNGAREQSGSDVVEAPGKQLEVAIDAEANVVATLLRVDGVVLLIMVIVVLGVWLSHR